MTKLVPADRVQRKIFVLRGERVFTDEFLVELYGVETRVLGHRGGRRYPPHVFTEQGVAMLSAVLKSRQAIQVNIQIMRAFVALRRHIIVQDELRSGLAELERKLTQHDVHFRSVFEAIRQLMAPPPLRGRRRIGFANHARFR
jgi:hypothetical protein